MFRLLIIAFILSFSLPAACKSYLLVGDSYAYLLGREFKKLAKKDGIKFKTNARGGTNSSQWIDNKWFERSLFSEPDVVLVSLGVNDAGVPSLRKRFESNAVKIVNIAKERNIEVFWILPPKVYYNTDYIDKGLVIAKPCYIFDSRKLKLDLEKDRVHPTFWANKIWAVEIWKELNGL